ncbi:hypothetical protein EYF80_048270 [Liparis tanakae]|uniref:Uncharacterized protein n=1 Tax=Liparis tanakae TaxID=230148 RepID=A0A4Z2FK03_9TELE|nr:hypothetical protein EYF80_048270 [Liparis tanakae]
MPTARWRRLGLDGSILRRAAADGAGDAAAAARTPAARLPERRQHATNCSAGSGSEPLEPEI